MLVLLFFVRFKEILTIYQGRIQHETSFYAPLKRRKLKLGTRRYILVLRNYNIIR